MNHKAIACFNAGLLAGRLQGALTIAPDDPRIKAMTVELTNALQTIGLTAGAAGLPLPPFEELTKQVRQLSSEKESACFDLGADLLPLQTHLKMISLISPAKATPIELSQVAMILRALVDQMRLKVARIGASEVADPFLQRLGTALTSPVDMIGASASMFAETEVLRVRLDAWLHEQAEPASPPRRLSSRVFLVHGHNNERKEAVARFLESLGLEPVILHEKPNAGRTIIEKFSDYADVQFAIVLLTADDEGKPKGTSGRGHFRARQNVILELGYFLGKLGRQQVCTLYESGVELPSDYAGVLFLPFDSAQEWRLPLLRELKAAGVHVDANKIL